MVEVLLCRGDPLRRDVERWEPDGPVVEDREADVPAPRVGEDHLAADPVLEGPRAYELEDEHVDAVLGAPAKVLVDNGLARRVVPPEERRLGRCEVETHG